MEIKLKKGVAIIKDFINRKTQKEYQNTLFQNVKIRQGMEAQDLELELVAAEAANDSLVLNMLESVDDKEVTAELLEGIDSDDFNSILEACQKILNKNDEDKKK